MFCPNCLQLAGPGQCPFGMQKPFQTGGGWGGSHSRPGARSRTQHALAPAPSLFAALGQWLAKLSVTRPGWSAASATFPSKTWDRPGGALLPSSPAPTLARGLGGCPATLGRGRGFPRVLRLRSLCASNAPTSTHTLTLKLWGQLFRTWAN